MAKKRYGIDLDPELVRRIDERRGGTPRQVWIAQAIAEALGEPLLVESRPKRGKIARALEAEPSPPESPDPLVRAQVAIDRVAAVQIPGIRPARAYVKPLKPIPKGKG